MASSVLCVLLVFFFIKFNFIMICTGVMGTKIKIGERKKEEDNDTINNYTKRKLKEKKVCPTQDSNLQLLG